MKSLLHYFLLLAVTATAAHGQNLQAVLSRMDSAGVQFKAMTSHMDRITHVAVIDDDTPESGSIRITRSKNKDIRVSLDFTKPEPKQVAISERKVEIYYPKANRVEEYDLGKYKSLVDQFVLLGFGTTGKDLQKAYNLKFLKEDAVAGQKCSRIELEPKDSKVKKQYSKFELCIAEPGGYPVLQKLMEPSGNYTRIIYSDIKLNPDLGPEAMNLNLPAGVKREYPQK